MAKAKKLTKEELGNIQGLIGEFNKVKIQLGETVLAQQGMMETIAQLRAQYAQAEQELIEKYGQDSVINIDTGEVSEKEAEVTAEE